MRDKPRVLVCAVGGGRMKCEWETARPTLAHGGTGARLEW